MRNTNCVISFFFLREFLNGDILLTWHLINAISTCTYHVRHTPSSRWYLFARHSTLFAPYFICAISQLRDRPFAPQLISTIFICETFYLRVSPSVQYPNRIPPFFSPFWKSRKTSSIEHNQIKTFSSFTGGDSSLTRPTYELSWARLT